MEQQERRGEEHNKGEQLRYAAARCLDRMDGKGETAEQAAGAVCPDYADVSEAEVVAYLRGEA